MKKKRILTIMLSLAMMVILMPVMAFANDNSQGEAPTNAAWDVRSTAQYATWQPITNQEYIDNFSYYAVKAFWKSPDETQTADSSSVYPEEDLNNGYCVIDGADSKEYSFEEFFETYGPGTYSFEVKAVYHSYEDSALLECQGTSFKGAKVIVESLDSTGAKSSVEGGGVMFSLGQDAQYKQIKSGNYLTFANNTTLYLEANPYGTFNFVGYSFKNSPTIDPKAETSYTLTEDDEITATFKQGDTVPVTVALGKGHEVLARSLRSEIQEDDSYICSLNSDETELTIQWRANKTIEEAINYLDNYISGSEAISTDEKKSYYGLGLKALPDYSGYEELWNEEREVPITEAGVRLFAHWAKPAKVGSFSVSSPICGSEVSTKNGEFGPEQTNKPVVKADKNSQFILYSSMSKYGSYEYWVKTKALKDLVIGDNYFSGKIEGGKPYIAGFFVYPAFGYYIDYELAESDPQPLDGDYTPLDPGQGTVPGGGSQIDRPYPEIKADFKVNGKPVAAQFDIEMIYLATDVGAVHDWEYGTAGRKCKYCGAYEKITPLMATVKAKGKKGVKVTWNAMTGADGYDVFFARCNTKKKKYTCKKAGTVASGKPTSWSKSGLKKGVPYKVYVKAYVMKDGKKTYIAKSPTVHAFTNGGSKKYTNPKSVKVKTSVSVNVGKTYKLKPSVTKLKKGKKLINTNHAPKLRYLSSDTSVATVSKSGKIKGVAAGNCKVYVLAANGAKKAVKVTVK